MGDVCLMYFFNDDHKKNYRKLQLRFPQVRNDVEYQSACYLCSVPGIFNRFNINELEHGPFDWLYDDISLREQTTEESERLYWLRSSRGDYYLALLGLQFWNGNRNDFQLNNALYNWNIEYLKVFEQACKIYRKIESVPL